MRCSLRVGAGPRPIRVGFLETATRAWFVIGPACRVLRTLQIRIMERDLMKKFLVAVAAAGVIGFASSADAQELASPAPVAMEAPVAMDAPATIVHGNHVYQGTTRVRTSNRRGGFLRDLIELERRKNAWLRRTFLGR